MPTTSRPSSESAEEYLRGVVGGLLFSLPMLYTMEVWWSGFLFTAERLLILLAFTFLLLLGYNTYAGVHEDETIWGVIIDSVEELGLGLVISALVLFVLNRLSPGDSIREMVGKIVVEATLVAIGVSVGTAQLGSRDDKEHRRGKEDGPSSIHSRVVLAACGGVILATNVAPTEEIVLIGLESTSLHLLGMVALSLVLTLVILNFSKLMGRSQGEPSWQKYVSGCIITYSVALLVSALILWLFGRFDQREFSECMNLIVVLALPASLGASAGRLLIH